MTSGHCGQGMGMAAGASNGVSTADHMYGAPMSGVASSNGQVSTAGSTIRGRSKVWNEFSVTPDGNKVTCRLCGESLSYSNSHSTSSMLKHLKRKHNLDLYPTNEDESNVSSDRFNRSQMPANPASAKRTPPKPKKHIPKDAEELDTSIQHGPLLFKDPCVRMKWTDHSDTFLRTFSSLYADESYADVTIVVEKTFFKAHRVILSSASDFFDEAFKMTPPGQHPVIFLKDVKAMDLRILLDFIYKGEVSIPPSLIPGLVKIGSDLRVRGLSDFVWNEQMAGSIFQPQTPQTQVSQSANSHEIRNSRPVQQDAGTSPPHSWSPPDTTPQISRVTGATGITNSCNSGNPVITPVRTVVRHAPSSLAMNGVIHQQQQSQQTPPASNGTNAPRNYSRVVNIRPANAGLQGQMIAGDLGAVCSSVATTFPAMKRIRIVTSGAPGFPSKPGGGKIGTDSTNLNAIGTDTNAETVLMVTNEGETVLSTTQGGVTVLTPNSSMAMPLGVPLKDNVISGSNNPFSDYHTHLQPHPVAVLTPSHNQPREMDEVVYSIAEIPGGGHEVLMADEHEMVVCGEETEQVEKKPFLPT